MAGDAVTIGSGLAGCAEGAGWAMGGTFTGNTSGPRLRNSFFCSGSEFLKGVITPIVPIAPDFSGFSGILAIGVLVSLFFSKEYSLV